MTDITEMSKGAFKKLVKEKVLLNALEYLTNKKGSKSQDVLHEEIVLQEYLAANNEETSVEKKQFAFKCRSRMLPLKANMKQNEIDLSCSACGLSEENQLHLLQCQVLNGYDNKNTHEIEHEEIYSQDVKQMFIATSAMKNRLDIFNKNFKTKTKVVED